MLTAKKLQTHVLLTALLLQLTEDKHHVRCAFVSSEATLTFWEVFFGNRWNKPVE